jgi:peptide/nickel transport system substrate-binding protein
MKISFIHLLISHLAMPKAPSAEQGCSCPTQLADTGRATARALPQPSGDGWSSPCRVFASKYEISLSHFLSNRMLAYFRGAVIFLLASMTLLDAVEENKQEETPQYGGTLNVGSVYITLSPLSWDPADWAWKGNHDTGLVRELLFAGDLKKSVRNGGRNAFISEAYLPEDAMRGELAETWFWEDPITLVINLRKGIMFAERPGLMEAREFDAEDVAYSYNIVNESPKRIPTYFDHIKDVVARDRHTVVFYFNQYHAEWPYRYGYGFYCQIIPREMANVDPKDWHNVHGTGPFTLERYIQSNAQIYRRNPQYWDKEQLGDGSYQLPFIDKFIYRIIRDEATFLSALRTGQLDILEAIRWLAVDHLKKTTPDLKWNRWLRTEGTFLAMRVDTKPFDDIRVRRAMNLAVNQREIVDLFFDGHGELMAYPQHPDFGAYYRPLEEMPESSQWSMHPSCQ